MTAALQRVEQDAMDNYRRTSLTLQDLGRSGGIDPMQSAQISIDTTSNTTLSLLGALKRIAREVDGARERELDGKALVAAVERGVWRVATVAVAVWVAGTLMSRLF